MISLRRFYGFLDHTKPSIKTLNKLSIYLGFRSYGNYLDKSSNYESWYFQQNLSRLKLKSTLDIIEIEEINVALLNQENVIYFAYFTSYFIHIHDIKSLKIIFKYCQLSDISGPEIHKFSTILSTTLLGLEEKNALAIYSELLNLQNFRDHVPLLFIDYANLTSRYGRILDLINKKSDRNSDLFFVSFRGLTRASKFIHIPRKLLTWLDSSGFGQFRCIFLSLLLVRFVRKSQANFYTQLSLAEISCTNI